MKRLAAGIVVFVLALSLSYGPVMAQHYATGGLLANQQHPSGEMMLYDLVLVRPVAIAACGIGLVGSVLALPFAAMSNSDREVSRKLISEPFSYTFTRPLGHFENNK